MTHSFRLRLAFLSALLSGVVLLAFGISAWWLIRGIKIDHLDSDVHAQAERESQRTRDAAGWQRTEASMASEMGLRDAHDLALMVQDASGKNIYRSSGWPASLRDASLPWPPALEPANLGPPPPPPRDGGGLPPQPAADDVDSAQPAPRPASRTLTLFADGQNWRIGLAVSAHARIAVIANSASIEAEMRGIFRAFLIALPLCLALTGFGGWVISSQALRPLRKLTATACRVTAEGLDQRILNANEDREFVELIEVFNGMLERLERSFKQSHRFSADAAHELKTPLAILQGQLERAIHTAEDGSTLQGELSSILDEVRRLSTISRKLLLLSRADAGNLNIHAEPFLLSETLTDLVEDTMMLAPHLLVTGEIHPGLMVQADATLLPQVFHNLISNAIKYNVDHGWIRISTSIHPAHIQVQVANPSLGITPDDRDKVFDRFFRADTARARSVDGVGLGLSVSREIARAHGGDISFTLDQENIVRFSLALPSSTLVPDASAG